MKTNKELIFEYLKDLREEIFRRKNGDKPKCSLVDLWHLVADVERRVGNEIEGFIRVLKHIQKVNNNKCKLVEVAIDTHIRLLEAEGKKHN